MCEHAKDLRGIHNAIKHLADANKTSSEALTSLAQTQAEMGNSMAVYTEKLKTIDSRGCVEGEKMNRRLFDEFKLDMEGVKKDAREDMEKNSWPG